MYGYVCNKDNKELPATVNLIHVQVYTHHCQLYTHTSISDPPGLSVSAEKISHEIAASLSLDKKTAKDFKCYIKSIMVIH